MAAHNVLLGRTNPFLIIEDMNLEEDLDRLRSVWIVPWHVESVDSVPGDRQQSVNVISLQTLS